RRESQLDAFGRPGRAEGLDQAHRSPASAHSTGNIFLDLDVALGRLLRRVCLPRIPAKTIHRAHEKCRFGNCDLRGDLQRGTSLPGRIANGLDWRVWRDVRNTR